jgi:hypothetical protein
MDTDRLLERLASEDTQQSADRAPARLKSRIYSALVNRLAAAGPLRSLPATKASGCQLCVFEEIVAALPLAEETTSKNPCRVCHARALGERLSWAPIFWPGCPYSEFHNG